MGTPRLCTGPRAEGKRDSEAKARRREHAAAFEASTYRITRHIADEIRKPGMRLLEEIGAGAKRGPGEVIEEIVAVSRDHKPEHDAIAIGRTLMHRLGYGIFALTVETDLSAAAYTGTIAGTVRRVAALAEAALTAVDLSSDGGEDITDAELPGILQLIEQTSAALRELNLKVQTRAARKRIAVASGAGTP